MIYSGSGNLPHHIYCWVDSAFLRKGGKGFERCVWFGIHSHVGRMWGCHIMLECGAFYRGVPPHVLSFRENPEMTWRPEDAQHWDCYGTQFSAMKYDYLATMPCEVKGGQTGEYLFTTIPLFDGFTQEPEQSKEFMWVSLDNGRLTIQPTDRILFNDRSFTEPEWPTDLKRTRGIWSVE